MLTDKINNSVDRVSVFFGNLFRLRDQMHLTHLRPVNPGQVGSYAQHVALNSFYDDLLGSIDSLIESYQGKYGLVNISVPASTTMDPVSALEGLANLLDGGSTYNMFKETWIQNQLDEITTLCYQTIYKLKFLK